MSEITPAREPRSILSGLKSLIGYGSNEHHVNPKEVTRTSEIRSSDGLMVVGDSMRKMDALEDAREAGTLIEDGDAPQFEKTTGKK